MKKHLSIILCIIICVCLLSACQSAGDKTAAEGAKAYGEKDYAAAITLLEQANSEGLNKYSQFELELMLADCYVKTGMNDEAIVACEMVIANTKTTGHYRAYHIMGIAQNHQGDYEEALASFESALEFDQNNKDSVGLYNDIGNVCISLNELLKAIDYLNRAVKLDPTFAESYGNLAIAYAALFDFESAEAALADAKTQGYDKVEAVQQIIDKYKGFGDFVQENTD